jgi:ABC-2 type transport system ATP-binding protein
MARKAKLYLMDEPTAGMDPAFRKEFYDLLREILAEGATVLMSTHVQSDINRNMDYVLTLKEGKQLRFQENFGEAEEWSEVEI